ncbi:sugar transferase [Halomonas litopenaei]|uniref:sugar transferase n=1 Tax=Halomonas litopenaei TaxID=2109328 RepID=UPI000C48B04D|nr:sugar transferase [Halomonas sp.]
MAKRCVDVLVAASLLVLLSPLMLGIWGLVRLRLGKPAFFFQWRPGLHGRPYRLIKFRTLAQRCDEQGRPLPDDQRMTTLGCWLRASSLDELPELWNVLKGEMSLVGPRPLLMEYLPLYDRNQARRHEVRPGITGWAQVNGRNALSWRQRFQLDVWYVDHHSLALDIRILAMTVVKVLRREGISGQGSVTMEPFRGNE